MHTTVGRVRFEHRDEALGIGTARPRLSWQLRTADPDWAQTAYELERGDNRVLVESAEQILVPWPFEPLVSREKTEVRVRVRSAGQWSRWSEPSTVEAGLFAETDWRARFISPVSIDGPAPILRRTITVRGDIVSARLYATAHGVYQAWLGDAPVGTEVLAPGWTSYQHRLRYQIHDVTALLRDGDNTLTVLLGNGWYRGRLAWAGKRAFYGDRLALLAQLEIQYADGSTDIIGTDEQWTAGPSGILADDLYDGQHTDLRPHESIVDSAVEVVPGDLKQLVAPDGPPVRITEVLPAVTVSTSPSGRTLVDFGQNLVGRVRLRLRNTKAGNEITVRHAEVLDNGELGTRPLRSAKATDTYILADADEAVLESLLTFHGFRYAEITGATVQTDDVEAVVIGTDLRRTGWFSCSDPLLEQFHRNVLWGMRGNFLDVPTDCPQRDERLGWTGDIQVFSPTASFLFDVAGFLNSWLADLAEEQHSDGAVPFVIPDVLHDRSPAATAWGDAAAVVPWVLYQRFGDVEILRRQFDSMSAWVDKIAGLSTDGAWVGGFQFGDWLDPDAPPDNPFAAKADHDVVATANLARSAQILVDTADILGRDAQKYRALVDNTREAFARNYVSASGRIVSDAPTVYTLALEWALLPTAAQREHAAERLADLVRTNGFRISTGFVGTPLIADALSSSGRPGLAYRLLLEKGCPSWLYPVTMGATTVWERWDSMLPDGSINPGEMTSFNHYALGAVADWMHRSLAGLAPAAPGYREITVKPLPDNAFTSASASHETPYGPVSVSWRRGAGQFNLDIDIPPGCIAHVHLPGAEPRTVRHGTHHWTVPDPVTPQGKPATVRELIDHTELWIRVADALCAAGIGADRAEIARRCAPYLNAEPAELANLLALSNPAVDDETAHQTLHAILEPEDKK